MEIGAHLLLHVLSKFSQPSVFSHHTCEVEALIPNDIAQLRMNCKVIQQKLELQPKQMRNQSSSPNNSQLSNEGNVESTSEVTWNDAPAVWAYLKVNTDLAWAKRKLNLTRASWAYLQCIQDVVLPRERAFVYSQVAYVDETVRIETRWTQPTT